MTLVSLIMPVWKPRPDWLSQAVESALAEHACDIELIVVDDGNEQPVATLLNSLEDPRLRIMRVNHGGPYAARNAGLQAARGDYIRFVDSDDTVEPGSTGKLLTLAIAADNGTIVFGATMMCDAKLKPLRVVTEMAEGYQAENCLLGGFNVYVVSILYPRALLERAGPWEETAFRVSGDWDFVLRTLEHGPVRGLGEVVSHYRRNQTSVSRSAHVSEGVQAAALVVQRYLSRHPEQRGSLLENRAYLNVHLHGMLSHFGRGEIAAALRQLTLAARRNPIAALGAAASLAANSLGVRRARAKCQQMPTSST